MLHVADISLRAGEFALRDVNLRIAPRELFALMGPTGSGKSLLARCICGLLRAASGSISVAGRDVTRLEPRLRGIGYVPQEGSLFPHMDAAHNLTFARRVRGESHRTALRELAPAVEMLGLGPLLERQVGTLSGGECQKVALGRALAVSPRLLVLDEPLSALDEPTRREVAAELVHVLRQLGIATLYICHNVQEAETLADRVGVMSDGRLVQEGTLNRLRREPAHAAVRRLLGPIVAGPPAG